MRGRRWCSLAPHCSLSLEFAAAVVVVVVETAVFSCWTMMTTRAESCRLVDASTPSWR